MRIASNKIGDITSFFHSELSAIYEKEEIEVFIRLCFETYVNLNQTEIFLNFSKTVNESELLRFNSAVKNLKNQKPIQYILGKTDFYKSTFIVNSSVLIPRPETEELVDLIIKENDMRSISIIDIGTGSGCIAISLKKNHPAALVYAMDVSMEALATAKENAVLNNAPIELIEASIFDNNFQHLVPASLDIIVSNPPYICFTEKNSMQKNVLDYEPHMALFVPDDDPLLFYKAITKFALEYLKPGGKLYCEINPLYGDKLLQLLEKKGFKSMALIKDLNNKNRILRGKI